jgi:predicted acetyltransferase
METEELTLVKPALALRAGFLRMLADLEAAGEHRYAPYLDRIHADFGSYLQLLDDISAGRDLPEGTVPQTVLWLVRNGQDVIGAVHLRHRLTPDLEHEGGHIGYHISPSERGQGYATIALTLALDRLRSFGWSRVLVTCDADNLASARVIEKNGGKLAGTVQSKESGQLVSRYWIDF